MMSHEECHFHKGHTSFFVFLVQMNEDISLQIQNYCELNNKTIWTKDFILLACGNLLMAIAFYFLIPTLPVYLENVLKANKSTTGWVIAMYSIAALIIRPLTGKALDTLGRKTIFLFAFALFALLFSGYIFAYTIVFLAVLRFVHGIAWGMVSTSNSTVVVDIIPPERRGEGIGYFGLSMTIGMALGPVIGLAITNNISYESCFLTGCVIAFAGFILALFVKYPKFIPHPENNTFHLKNLLEKKSFPVSLAIFCIMIPYGGLLSFVAIYGKEIGLRNPGIFFIIYAIGIGISRLYSGKIFDRYGPVALNYSGLGLLAIGLPLLALERNMTGFMISAAVMGFANGIIFPTFQAMINNLVPMERRGAANSTYFTAVDLGIGTGMVLMGTLGDALTLPYAYLSSTLFIIASALICLGFANPHYKRNKL
jgi:MFS family permease